MQPHNTQQQTILPTECKVNPSPTKRSSARGVEDYLQTALPALNHGFVRVLDYMGSDHSIADAARFSNLSLQAKFPDDFSLFHELLTARVLPPFRACSIKFQISLPVLIALDWFRYCVHTTQHKTPLYSNYSDDTYLPLLPNYSHHLIITLRQLAIKYPIPPRTDGQVTVSQDTEPPMSAIADALDPFALTPTDYVVWIWKTDLLSLFQFLHPSNFASQSPSLRQYSDNLHTIVAAWVPHAWAAFLQTSDDTPTANH